MGEYEIGPLDASTWDAARRQARRARRAVSSRPTPWPAQLASRAAAAGVTVVDVIANPNALGFYERVGFKVTGEVSTRFGQGVRMSLDLSQ